MLSTEALFSELPANVVIAFCGEQEFRIWLSSRPSFDWLVFARNWDLSVIAIIGAIAAIRNIPAPAIIAIPVGWLAWETLVFSVHVRGGHIIMVHIAPPLCWVCGNRRATVWIDFVRKRTTHTWPSLACCYGSDLLDGEPVFIWKSQIFENCPGSSSSLVLQEIQRFKTEMCILMFTDDFDLFVFMRAFQCRQNLAVVPQKRLWAGEMTAPASVKRFGQSNLS